MIPPDKVEGNNVRYSNMTFGQGMDTTMIQTATAFSSLINGGNLYRPSLINGEVTQEGAFEKNEAQIHRRNVISEDTSKQIKQILISARANANRGGADSKGYNIGGKTGTSQTLIDGKYVDNQTIGSYLGFGGGKQSEYVIMVAVWGKNQNLQGHSDASPIFTDISNWMLNYLEVKPTEG
ncbi:penicillin-binding protein [Chlamydia trachomatis]|nr:penicillin-binding protein [Chlamydia trachomatis]